MFANDRKKYNSFNSFRNEELLLKDPTVIKIKKFKQRKTNSISCGKDIMTSFCEMIGLNNF